TGFAANLKRSLAVTYRDIKIYYNGMLRNFQNEPFIVDEQGRTYLPVNDMALLFDKTISWDNATSSINITDKPGQGNTMEMYNQIIQLQQQVTKLENENKKLKDELKEEEKVDIDDLEDDLNKKYGKEFRSDGVLLEISLTERKDGIRVTIEALDRYDDDEFIDDVIDAVGKSDLEDLLEDIYDDITDEYDEKVYGTIEDGYGKMDFDFDKKGNVDLDY
ncbi:MAG: hypothetical protein GX231_07950, partial [Tissierellia bacterium]|nr:hypothetical protein [Tissierellia bacterium]